MSRNPVPKWDLSLVLNRLASAPFEPLHKAPLKLLTWKTVFLLALASGRRRGELHALDASKISWKSDHSKVSLGVIPSFLSKTQLASAPPLAIQIPALDVSLGTDLDSDAKLCPLRSLRLYLRRTKLLRANKKLLFISYLTKFSKDIQSPTISSWIKKCIKLCYDLAEEPTDASFRVKAHDVRAMAATLAYLGNTPLSYVMNACSWASHNTFTSFYLRELTWTHEDSLQLGPLVAGQTVVGPL